MTKSRVIQLLDEWRRLERHLSEGPFGAADRVQLHARIEELRAEYQRLTAGVAQDADVVTAGESAA